MQVCHTGTGGLQGKGLILREAIVRRKTCSSFKIKRKSAVQGLVWMVEWTICQSGTCRNPVKTTEPRVTRLSTSKWSGVQLHLCKEGVKAVRKRVLTQPLLSASCQLHSISAPAQCFLSSKPKSPRIAGDCLIPFHHEIPCGLQLFHGFILNPISV